MYIQLEGDVYTYRFAYICMYRYTQVHTRMRMRMLQIFAGHIGSYRFEAGIWDNALQLHEDYNEIAYWY